MLSTLAALLATLTGLVSRRLVLLIALTALRPLCPPALAALLMAALLTTLVLLLISILVAHRRSFLNAPPRVGKQTFRLSVPQINCLAAPNFSARWCIAPCQMTLAFPRCARPVRQQVEQVRIARQFFCSAARDSAAVLIRGLQECLYPRGVGDVEGASHDSEAENSKSVRSVRRSDHCARMV